MPHNAENTWLEKQVGTSWHRTFLWSTFHEFEFHSHRRVLKQEIGLTWEDYTGLPEDYKGLAWGGFNSNPHREIDSNELVSLQITSRDYVKNEGRGGSWCGQVEARRPVTDGGRELLRSTSKAGAPLNGFMSLLLGNSVLL